MAESLDLDLAASFLTLVDEWSYIRAADELHISTPTLTKRIQRLERRLGVSLLQRGPEGLTGMTPAGMEFARAARPLLQQARALERAVQVASEPRHVETIRVGVPAGATSFVEFMGLDTATRDVRRQFPSLIVKLVEVPFPLINRCLPEEHVDLLLTIAPVAHRMVRSTPLPVTAARLGVVSMRHELADAGAVDVEAYGEHRLLWNPTIAPEWMCPFWLGDLRISTDAKLTPTHCTSNQRVFHQTHMGAAAIITLSPDRPHIPRGLNAVTLTGAPAVRFYAANRRSDHRAGLRIFVDHLQGADPQHLGDTGRPDGPLSRPVRPGADR